MYITIASAYNYNNTQHADNTQSCTFTLHVELDMAKRARLSAEEVIENLDESLDVADCEDWEGLDAVQEPITQGSDDEFSDLEEKLEEEEEEYYETLEVEVLPNQDTRQTEEREENGGSGDEYNDENIETDAIDTHRENDSRNRDEPETPTIPLMLPRDGTTWSPPVTLPLVQPFTSPVGPTTTIPESPLAAFLLTFTPTIASVIVRESNKYAREIMGEERFQKWEQISEKELRAYLGFSILMAIAHVPALDDYWKRDPVLRYSPVADRITRDRFRDISRYLHFADNSTIIPRGNPGHDRLGKIRPVLTHFCERFSTLYNPPRELSVDEAMIKFQGRSSLKQYMPMKPIKRGIKVWVLADSVSGYFSRLEVYSGKQNNQVETGLGSRVVRSLSADFHGKYHHIIFDNYFTGYQLLEDLLEVGAYGCGTARKDRRGFPQSMKTLKFKNR